MGGINRVCERRPEYNLPRLSPSLLLITNSMSIFTIMSALFAFLYRHSFAFIIFALANSTSSSKTFLYKFEGKIWAEPWEFQVLTTFSMTASIFLMKSICRQLRARYRTNQNSKTGLLSLPPEMRNIIWSYTVVDPGPEYTVLRRYLLPL